jgi:hypothetical protein
MNKLLMILGFSAALSACDIEWHDDPWDDEWDDETTLEERAADTCDAYCMELVECGALSDSAFVSCRDHCIASYEADEEEVYDGCACVMEAECDAEEANECEDAPLPGVFPDPDGTGGTTASGGSSSGGSGDGGASEDPEAPTCSVDHDCALGEDCIEGECKGRCVASCQCDEGQACVEGYCEEPQEPVIECEDDCDCTSGERCVEGACE